MGIPHAGTPAASCVDVALHHARTLHWSSPDLSPLKSRLLRAGRWAKDFLVCMDRTRTFGLAAETAFWLFLSLLPMAAVMGLVAARLSIESWSDMVPLVGQLPPAAQDFVMKELFGLASWNQGQVGITAAAVFVWLASSGMHGMFDAIELESGATRPWWKKRLLALAACVALSVAVAVLTWLGPGLEGALGWFGRWLPFLARSDEPTTAGRVLRFLLGVAVVFGFVCALYRVGVPARVRSRFPIVPGALLAVALELLFGAGYALYLSTVGDGGAYMAGLAVIGVTMTALFLFTTAVLVGAVLNRQLAGDPCPVSPTGDAKSARPRQR